METDLSLILGAAIHSNHVVAMSANLSLTYSDQTCHAMTIWMMCFLMLLVLCFKV